MAMPSIMANSCLMGQYFCMSCATSYVLCGKPCMTYNSSSCVCASLAVASHISHIDVHTGRSTAVLIVLMSMLRLHISLSSFSSWLCHDNKSAINSPGPGLYSMCTLYWCMHRIMHCMHCDNDATSLPIIDTNGLWSVMMYSTCYQHW